MGRIRKVVILKTRVITKNVKEMTDVMIGSVRDAVLRYEPNWEVDAGIRERQMSKDDENYTKIAILFQTMTCDPRYLAKKIRRLRQRDIKVYIISSVPKENWAYKLIDEHGLAGMEEYPFDPVQFVGELRMLFLSAGG